MEAAPPKLIQGADWSTLEQLTAEMSAENRAQIEAIFRLQEDELISAVAEGRSMRVPPRPFAKCAGTGLSPGHRNGV